MHIGVEITIAEHLIKKATGGEFSDLGDIVAGTQQPINIINANAINPFDDQHLFGAMFKINPWNIDAVIMRQIIGQPSASGRFKTKIKLCFRNFTKLRHRFNEFQPPKTGGRPF